MKITHRHAEHEPVEAVYYHGYERNVFSVAYLVGEEKALKFAFMPQGVPVTVLVDANQNEKPWYEYYFSKTAWSGILPGAWAKIHVHSADDIKMV